MLANLVGVKRHVKVPLICLIIVTASLPVGANIRISVTGSPQPLSHSSGLCLHIAVSLCLYTPS